MRITNVGDLFYSVTDDNGERLFTMTLREKFNPETGELEKVLKLNMDDNYVLKNMMNGSSFTFKK